MVARNRSNSVPCRICRCDWMLFPRISTVAIRLWIGHLSNRFFGEQTRFEPCVNRYDVSDSIRCDEHCFLAMIRIERWLWCYCRYIGLLSVLSATLKYIRLLSDALRVYIAEIRKMMSSMRWHIETNDGVCAISSDWLDTSIFESSVYCGCLDEIVASDRL